MKRKKLNMMRIVVGDFDDLVVVSEDLISDDFDDDSEVSIFDE